VRYEHYRQADRWCPDVLPISATIRPAGPRAPNAARRGQPDRHRPLFMPGHPQGAGRRVDSRGGAQVPGMHQSEQCPRSAFRGTFVGADDDLGREHVHPAQLRDPRRDDLIPSPEGEVIDAVLPFVGGGQRGWCGSRTAAIHGEPVRDDVEQQSFTTGGRLTWLSRSGSSSVTWSPHVLVDGGSGRFGWSGRGHRRADSQRGKTCQIGNNLTP
jgi:hypothetical protein